MELARGKVENTLSRTYQPATVELPDHISQTTDAVATGMLVCADGAYTEELASEVPCDGRYLKNA